MEEVAVRIRIEADVVAAGDTETIAGRIEMETVDAGDTEAEEDMVAVEGATKDEEENQVENYRDVAAFLDVLTSAVILRNNDFHYIKGAYFHKSSRENMETDIGQGIVVRKGFEKSVKLVSAKSGNPQYSLNLAVKTKPFYKPGNFHEFLMMRSGARNDHDLAQMLKKESAIRDLAKNVIVTTTHLDANFDFGVHHVHKESAKECIIPGLDQSVAMYYQERYKLTLRAPSLPLATENKKGQSSYYPLELLEVSPIQSVPVGKLKDQQAKVVEMTRLKPDEHQRDMEQLIPQMGLGQGNLYLQQFGVTVEQRPVEVDAVQVIRPALVFGSKTFGPDQDQSPNELNWNGTFRERFYKPAKIGKTAVVIYRQAVRHPDQLNGPLQMLADAARNHGLDGTENLTRGEVCHWNSMSDDEAARAMGELKARGFKFVIFVGAVKNTDTEGHRMIKYAEQKAGVVTQHLACPTLGINSRPMGSQSVQNILLKMNQKLGGINYSIAITPNMLQSAHNSAEMNTEFFGKSVMYVGLSVSHDGPQSIFDQQAGTEMKTPSTVGMCYSTETPTAFRGKYWWQPARQVLISSLKENFISALENFKKEVGEHPKKIIIFRGGLSEGEMYKNAQDEIDGKDGIKAATKALGIDPQIYVVLTIVHSSMRLLRTDAAPGGRPVDSNLPAGTTITQGIVDARPGVVDAFIVSQKGQIGTSRPTRLFLAYQTETAPLWTSDHLSWIGNAMSYAHGVSMCPTGIPAHLYAAMNLSKRGGDVLRSGGVPDNVSMTSSGSNRQADEEQSRVYYDRLCKELVVVLDNAQFWA
ncbi:unnamed protein product, partial [Mesorhabditis belari]|uniref:Piwi domain-containing protein n=1 Tax=Mesorhabditis belari TaxID=2138241 RepID=A0AAF3F257_9BILA